jgi:nucleoside-diphosphate-sugar epimerase
MKILVTGATGFIGSAFSKLALSHGHDIGGLMLPTEQVPRSLPMNRVAATPPSQSGSWAVGRSERNKPLSTSQGSRLENLNRKSAGAPASLPALGVRGSKATEDAGAPVHGKGKLTWIKGTLAELPWREIELFQPDACVHFAWIATPGAYLESPENEKHLEWSLNLARRLKTIGLRQFVGVGTCIEYKITNAPLHEERTPVDPTTLYSRCKNALREALEAEARRDGTHFCWGRVFYPYGVGEHPARLCSSLIQRFRRGEKLVLKTPHSTKDYIYIDDLAAAILLTVEQQFQGTINWGTGEGISVRQIADTVAALLGRPDLVAEVSPPEIDPLGYVVADATRLKSLGWRQQFNLGQGLRALLLQDCGTGL